MTSDWSTACPDWERRIVERQSLIPCPPLFPDEAKKALEVFGDLRLRDLAGRPQMREVSRPWVNDFVSAVFGAYDTETGRRLIREFFLLISKKNSKSTTAAGIMLTALIRNWRDSGEFLILAPTLEIANNAFFPARDMVNSDDELSDLLHVAEFHRTITHRTTGATLKVIAADNESVGGKKAIGVLIDELWLFGKKPHAENMLREATGGLASRPEGFVIYLSTQSDEPPAGVFDQKLKYARGVRDGEIEDKRFLPVIYEFPKAMVEAERYVDPSFFYITNPNLGASVDEEFLVRELGKAQDAGNHSLRGFVAKHLNVQIGQGLMSDSWAGADFWGQQGSAKIDLDYILNHCEVVTAGIDIGGTDDWLALGIVGREIGTGHWLHWGHAWAHPIAFDRRKSEASRWRDFVADGDLTVVEKSGQDVTALIGLIMRCEEAGLLERIGVDRHKIEDVYDGLVLEGIDADRIVAIDQGWKLVGSIGTTERRLAAGTFFHGGRRIMSYCVGNAKAEVKGNNVHITKQIAGAAKIDPLLAMFNAVRLMSLNPTAAKEKFQFFAIG